MAGRSLGLLLGKREGATRVKTGGTKDDRAPQRYCCDDCPAGGLVLHADVRFWCARRIQGIFGTKPRASCVMVPFMPAHMGMPFPRGADRFARRFRSLRARSQVSPGRPRDCGHVHMQGARSALSSAASDVDGRLSACRISQSRRAQPEIPRRRVGLTADVGSEAWKCAGRKFDARDLAARGFTGGTVPSAGCWKAPEGFSHPTRLARPPEVADCSVQAAGSGELVVIRPSVVRPLQPRREARDAGSCRRCSSAARCGTPRFSAACSRSGVRAHAP